MANVGDVGDVGDVAGWRCKAPGEKRDVAPSEGGLLGLKLEMGIE
jgi:hypothetical protein